jgi:hypothetical protein
MQRRCSRREFLRKTLDMKGGANSMWMKMSTYIRKLASEEFGVTKGGRRETKEI